MLTVADCQLAQQQKILILFLLPVLLTDSLNSLVDFPQFS